MFWAPRLLQTRVWLAIVCFLAPAGCGSDLDDPGMRMPSDTQNPSPSGDTLVQGAFTAQRVGASQFPGLIQVELVVSNLPDFAGSAGESVVVRGTGIFLDDSSPPFDWSSDQVRGVIQADRSTSIVFYQDLTVGGQSRTDFKVFRDAANTPVLVDRNVTTPGSEGNIQLELLSIAQRGDAVRITVDANDPAARASVPTLTTGIALAQPAAGERSNLEDLIEVELRLTNIPEALGSLLVGVGETLVVRGENIYSDRFAGPKSWDGDEVSGTVQSDRSATITFYQSLSLRGEQRTTNFKVFQIGTWNEIVVDNEQADGNIRLDLLQIASLGSKVVVTIDVSNRLAIPPIPDIVDGPLSARSLEERSRLPNLIEIELVLRNLVPEAGAAGDRVSVRGAGLLLDESNRYEWEGDQISGEIDGSRTATVSFFIEDPVLSFQVFRFGGNINAPVVIDSENANSRITMDLSEVARRGSQIQVVVNASDERLRAPSQVFVQGAYTVELDAAGSSTRCPALTEVEILIANLPEFAGQEGQRVVVRGNRIFLDDSTSSTWNGDDVGGEIAGPDRSARLEFCQDLSSGEQDTTDFGVYRDQTWARVLQDATVDNGNIQLELGRLAGAGEKVTIRVDASDPGALPDPPELSDPPFEGIFVSRSQNTLCPSLMEVDLVVESIPSTVIREGERVVVRGIRIFRDDTNQSTWSGDEIEATVEGSPGTALLTFCQDLNPSGQATTEFQVFRQGTSDVVAQDSDDPQNNIRLDLLGIGFPGSKVEVRLDASAERARP